jgi:thiol-disulfide isomerase/thioredoxin
MVIIFGVAAYFAYTWYAKPAIANKNIQNMANINQRDQTTEIYFFYADWCPHCKSAKPEMEALVAKGVMDINGTKCVVRMIQPEQQPEEAKGKPIKGFPTFLLETTDGETVEYKGQRNTAGYLSFLNENLGAK